MKRIHRSAAWTLALTVLLIISLLLGAVPVMGLSETTSSQRADGKLRETSPIPTTDGSIRKDALSKDDCQLEEALPGYQRAEAPLVPPLEAQKFLDIRLLLGVAPKDMGILSSTEATPEIQELARGLNNDADLIYEYVYNYIEYTPIFGSVKGATATLLDGKGNDFDQSSLMIALLRQAGYTADFVYGIIRLSPEQITNWLGIDNNVSAIGWLLGSAGIPAQIWINPDDSLAFVDVSHVWVKVNIDGTHYVFDPSFKTHSYTSSINLASAMSYNRDDFLSDALSGTTIGTDYVQSVNKTNLSNDLAAYAMNLVDYIKANNPGATLDDIVGGKSINPLATYPRQTSLPYEQSITSEWTDIPSQYQTSLQIQHCGVDETFYSCDIYGKRLTIFYNESNQPVLRLDGAVIATGSATTPGSFEDIVLSVDHPYAANGGTYCDDTQTFEIKAGGSYFVVNGWSETRQGMVEKHRNVLRENVHAGGEDTSEPILGESLAMVGYTWLAECGTADELADQLSKTFTIHHHMLGVCGQNESPYIDMPMCLVSVISGEDDSEKEAACFFSGSGHHSAFEWGVIDQLQDHSAVSTVKLIDISNDKADRIFDATEANYYSVVKPQLVNYNPSEFSYVEAYIDAGYRVILPQDGNLGEGDWTGIGFITISPSGNQIGHIISGALSGGFGIVEWILSGLDTVSDWFSGAHAQGTDPIDLVTGDYLYENTDLTVGSRAYPFSLQFKRSYNSGARLDDGPMGLGWTHNFANSARLGSDGFQGLGEDSPIDAAAAIIEHYVSIDILQGSKPIERLVIATLAHRWFMDQLIDNMVTVSEPGNTSKFLKLPDGTYNPPPGVASLLTEEANNSYLLQTRHGILVDFDTEGKMTAWEDPNGNTVTYTYSDGKLQSVSNGLGRSLAFTYDGDYISQISDGAGRSVNYTYDSAGNLITVTDCNGNSTTFAHDIDGRLTRVYYPANPADPFVTNTYDSLGRVETQTDAAGNAYQYYFSGYRAEEENPLGDSHIWYFNSRGRTVRDIDALGNETTSQYDGHNRLILETYPEGNSIAYEYDGNHNLIKETFNPKPVSTELPITKLYTYEPAFNQIKTFLNPLGHLTTLSYDSKGNVLSIEQPLVDGLIPETTFTYNSGGQVETVTDPKGMTTGYTYDPTTGDLLSVTEDQGGLNLITQMTYDAVGDLAQTTDPRGHTTTFLYDSMRQLTQTTAPPPLNYVTKYSCDPNGNLIRTERETGEIANPWQTTTISYTLTGKRETITDPQGHVTSYQYDQVDRLWKVTDAENHTTEYLYDPAGRLYLVIDPQGNISEEHSYTPNGRKQTLTDANNSTTQYIYDDFDRLKEIVYPDGSYEAFTYDSADNIAQKRTRGGEFIDYGYDSLNRLIAKTLPGPTSIAFSYDLTGRLVDATDPGGTINYEYDSAGRLVRVTYPDARSVEYEYDDAGNRNKLTYPDGCSITYNYDELDRLTEVLEGGTTLLAQYHYDSLSRRVGLVNDNGASTDYSYEIDNDLLSLQHQFSGSAVNLSYEYDDVHNRTGFTSDDERFLYSPEAPSQTSYVSNNLNQYTSVGGVSYTYDGNGNLASDGTNTYAYDAENRLISATTPEHSATYTYDPFGRRTAKTVDGATTAYLYDGDQVIVEYDGAGQMQRRYVYGPRIDEPVCMITPGDVYYYHFDGLGSVIALSNDTGNIVETYAYNPYGEVDQPSSVGNPYLYTGREYDSETGLYYYRARYYDAELGRFLQTDPVGYQNQTNLYVYCLNNPLKYRDYDGRVALLALGAIAFGVGALVGFGAYGASVLLQGGEWSWGQALGAGLGGGITATAGAVVAATGAAVATLAAVGAAAGFVGYAANVGLSQALTYASEEKWGLAKEWSWIEAGASTLISTLLPFGPKAISHIPGRWPKHLFTQGGWLFGQHSQALRIDALHSLYYSLAREIGSFLGFEISSRYLK